jgi:hypothetical protein
MYSVRLSRHVLVGFSSSAFPIENGLHAGTCMCTSCFPFNDRRPSRWDFGIAPLRSFVVNSAGDVYAAVSTSGDGATHFVGVHVVAVYTVGLRM